MPRSGSRGSRKARSQQLSREGTAAEAARGIGSPSQVPPRPPWRRRSTDTKVKGRCAICLVSLRKPSFVMPCLHRFCYACILQWANKKTQCPVCKGKMSSILHSVRADDDFEEHVIIPPMREPVVLPVRRARRESDAPNLHRPGAHQQRVPAGDVQPSVGGFELPRWMSCFSANSELQQNLYSWFCKSLEMLFQIAAPMAQHTHVPEQQHCREDRHLPRQWDTRGATRQENSSSFLNPGPARCNMDEMPSTSSSGRHPSASTTIQVAQEPQEESERLRPGLPNFIRGGDPSLVGPQRPQKRRASSLKGSPAYKRPRH